MLTSYFMYETDALNELLCIYEENIKYLNKRDSSELILSWINFFEKQINEITEELILRGEK